MTCVAHVGIDSTTYDAGDQSWAATTTQDVERQASEFGEAFESMWTEPHEFNRGG